MGSMLTEDESRFADRAIEAVRCAEARAVILGHLASMTSGAVSEDILLCEEEIPYGWLFPQCSCVVHHGGVGTVAAALFAGRPSIVVPQISAQQYLGNVLVRTGLATGVFDTAAFDPLKLAAAIRGAVNDQKNLQTAKIWQANITRDRGVLAAADQIEQHSKVLGR
jgi:sterol 3beta-glucosyltransferase